MNAKQVAKIRKQTSKRFVLLSFAGNVLADSNNEQEAMRLQLLLRLPLTDMNRYPQQ